MEEKENKKENVPEEESIHCKIVLIGESGVGKTSIINRLSSNTFSSEIKPTENIGTTTIEFLLEEKNKLIKFEILDTPGQEKYRSHDKILYENTNVILLIYDMTNSESFEKLKNYWKNEIKSKASSNTSK